MSIADKTVYLKTIVDILKAHWPNTRAVHVVCHGHSVPAGYFATPFVDTFNSYPHLLHRGLKERYPYAGINVIVTAIGGEASESGAARFEADVLAHRPDVVTIDYGLNDRGLGLAKAKDAWRSMIEKALAAGVRVILLTPTLDEGQRHVSPDSPENDLARHADQTRALAAEYNVGLADSFTAFRRYLEAGGDLADLLSWSNHPNRAGHEFVARELLRWFPA